MRRKPKIAPTFVEQGLSVVPPTTLLNFFILVMAYGRGVSLIRHARNAQQHSDHRGRYHSKATAAGEEGATCFAIFGVVDDWRTVSHDLGPFSLCS